MKKRGLVCALSALLLAITSWASPFIPSMW